MDDSATLRTGCKQTSATLHVGQSPVAHGVQSRLQSCRSLLLVTVFGLMIAHPIPPASPNAGYCCFLALIAGWVALVMALVYRTLRQVGVSRIGLSIPLLALIVGVGGIVALHDLVFQTALLVNL